RPTKKFGANISYQITQGNAHSDAFSMTNYHLYGGSDGLNNFINTDTPTGGQPEFIKHFVRASIESKINDKSGIIGSFNTTQSFIPVNAYANSYINNGTVLDSNQKTLKRQNYNFFFKSYYDIGESLRLEASYTYAPQYNEYFIRNTKDSNFYFLTGGHQLGLKSFYDNKLGLLNAQFGFSLLENSRAGSANDMRIWHYSAEKNWNPHGNAGEGGYGNVNTTQTDLHLKINQTFEPIKLSFWENKVNVGLELGYVHAKWEREHDTLQGFTPTTYLAAGQTCNDNYWCSASPVPSYQNGNNGGQWISQAFYYKAGKINVSNFSTALFVEDNMNFLLGQTGEINTRFGLRLDYDTYMNKAPIAPRFSLNYLAPWNQWEKAKEFATSFSFGANRYYGRNLYTYALLDGRNALNSQIQRDNETQSWNEARVTQQYRNNTRFEELNVPYSDELIAGFSQKIYMFSLSAKYIHRFGRDEIRRGCYHASGNFIGGSCGADGNQGTTGTNYYQYTNDGQSNTDVVTFMIQNNQPIDTFGVKHHYLLAFDWTNTKRNYGTYADNLSNDELANEWISYDRQLMRYADRPADNFMRPYTLRLNTTHTFQIWRTKWLWNNFLRYRSGYRAMANTNTNEQDSFVINGVLTKVATFRAFDIKGAFTWDMRIGFEIDMWHKNTLYVNLDIYNVLDSKVMAIYNFSSTVGSARFAATPVYEVGRQFWLQVGIKR
ncbi:TonB-dependent receptor, partial [Helicobacter sp. MIT 14-3879]|uniref:TonB-dependent receptor n=1 Tax=Helicobacter sp. MIT 14-3879 TaxID=2040649 RepID=UPI000E1F9FBC